MLQPPFDATLTSAFNGKPSYIIHYTYGNDFNEAGVFTPGQVGAWHWDKRDYSWGYPPVESFKDPPEGCTNEPVKVLIQKLKEAAENLPGWQERVIKT